MNACTAHADEIDDVALGVPASSALAQHLMTCGACSAQLERQRALAQRIDRAVADSVREEPPLGLAERIAARVAVQQPRRWGRVWLGVPAAVALAAGLLFFIFALGSLRTGEHPNDVATITAWRSPTASLLVSRSSVLATPFTPRSSL